MNSHGFGGEGQAPTNQAPQPPMDEPLPHYISAPNDEPLPHYISPNDIGDVPKDEPPPIYPSPAKDNPDGFYGQNTTTTTTSNFGTSAYSTTDYPPNSYSTNTGREAPTCCDCCIDDEIKNATCETYCKYFMWGTRYSFLAIAELLAAPCPKNPCWCILRLILLCLYIVAIPAFIVQ